MSFRLFINHVVKNAKPIPISTDDYHHLAKVLRVKPGCECDIVHEHCTIYHCELIEVTKQTLSVKIINKKNINQKNKTQLTLIQSLPKQDKFSDTLRMCTEIGVDHFIPLYTDRSIPIQDQRKEKNKMTRWESICLSSAMQSQRMNRPTLSAPQTLQSWLSQLKNNKEKQYDIALVPWEEEQSLSLKEHINSLDSKKKSVHIAIFIGPEGGLSEDEITSLTEHDFISVSLGETILRTQHAGFYTVAQLQYHYT